MNKKGEKFRLKYNPRLFMNIITESLGTIQINRPELKKFVDRINDDLNNKVYLDKPLTIEKDKKYMEVVLENPLASKRHYIMKYKDTGVDWIRNIDIMVIEDGGVTKSHFINCEAYPGITMFGDYSIQSGCIIAYNITGNKNIQDYRGALYHEFHHYFIELKRYVNTCHQLTDNEYYNSIFADNVHFNENKDNAINFIDYYDDNNYNDYINNLKSLSTRLFSSEINRIFTTMCYWLNKDEIESHLEEIFDIYVRYCKRYGYTLLSYSNKNFVNYSSTLKSYVVIIRLLKDIEKIINDNVEKDFNIRFGPQYYKIFKSPHNADNNDWSVVNKKSLSIHKICNKFRYKIKKLSDHFGGINVYAKYGYIY